MRRCGSLLLLSCPNKILEDGGVEVDTVVLPDGEEFKSLEVLTKILDKALSARLDRKTTFVALGGGVIGDMVGFAAAIYQRGVKFVQVRLLVSYREPIPIVFGMKATLGTVEVHALESG